MSNSLNASSRDLTLVELFDLTSGNFCVPTTAAILTVGVLGPLEKAILGEISYFPWVSFVGSLGGKSLELFQTRLLDILVGGWQKTQELLEFRDKTKHPPEEVATVPLFERSFTSEHHPYIEILFRQETYKVVFDVELKLALKELVLEIQDAKIKAVHSGSLEGSGSISLAGADLVTKEFPPVKLPGIVKLGESISI